jgi:hypothetical protein
MWIEFEPDGSGDAASHCLAAQIPQFVDRPQGDHLFIGGRTRAYEAPVAGVDECDPSMYLLVSQCKHLSDGTIGYAHDADTVERHAEYSIHPHETQRHHQHLAHGHRSTNTSSRRPLTR